MYFSVSCGEDRRFVRASAKHHLRPDNNEDIF